MCIYTNNIYIFKYIHDLKKKKKKESTLWASSTRAILTGVPTGEQRGRRKKNVEEMGKNITKCNEGYLLT